MCYIRALFPKPFSLWLSENKSNMWIICFLAPDILSMDSATLFLVLVLHHFLQAKRLGLYCQRGGGFMRWWCLSHICCEGSALLFMAGVLVWQVKGFTSPHLLILHLHDLSCCFSDWLDLSGLFLLGVKVESVSAQEVQQESEGEQGKLPLWWQQQQLQSIRLVSFALKGVFWDILGCTQKLNGQAESLKRQHCGINQAGVI